MSSASRSAAFRPWRALRPDARGLPSFATQTRVLAERLLDDLLASPGSIAMTSIFAVGFVVSYSGLLGGSAAITRELGSDYLPFIVPSGVLIASFASATGGHMLARDMEDGYLERLFTASISRVAIVLAPMLVGAGYALAQALAVLAVAALLGAAPVTGIAGAVAMLALAAAWGMAVTGYTSASALLTGDAEITRIVDVGFFSLLFFLSPILLPSDDLEGWLKPIARLNPATYVLEGMRSLMLEGWRPARLLPALAAALAFAALALSAAAGAARRRARRV